MAFPVALAASILLPLIPTVLGALGRKNKWAKVASDILGPLLGKDTKGMTYRELELELALVAKDKEVDLKKIELEFRGLLLDHTVELGKIDADIAKMQVKLLADDVKSENKVRSMWRPAIAWICVSGILLSGLIIPLVIFLMSIGVFFGVNVTTVSQVIELLLTIDLTVTLSVIIPMLGLGGYRTVEKLRGI